jgi:large subunit ribosomal protein L13
MKKTLSAKPSTVTRNWHVIDATDAIVGRLATKVASVLRGKHKGTFTHHIDTGDFVVVLNAEKARFTGKKETDKEYWHYTGFPGGGRSITPEKQRSKHPERIVLFAVKGMLPKVPLGRRMLKKLKVYVGNDHPHQAQQPKPLTL